MNFLWWIIVGNLSRTVPFAEQRLITEGVIHLNACLCTLLALLLPSRQWLAGEIQQGRGGALGISGVSVRVSCLPHGIHVDLLRAAGRPIHDEDRFLVVTIGSPTLSGSVALTVPAAGLGPTDGALVVREVIEDWLRRPGHPAQGQLDEASHRLEYADARSVGCAAPNGLGGSPGRAAFERPIG